MSGFRPRIVAHVEACVDEYWPEIRLRSADVVQWNLVHQANGLSAACVRGLKLGLNMEFDRNVPAVGDYCVVRTRGAVIDDGNEVGAEDAFGVAVWAARDAELVAYGLAHDEARDLARDQARSAGTVTWDITSRPYVGVHVRAGRESRA